MSGGGWTVSTSSDPNKVSPELGAAQPPQARRSPKSMVGLPVPHSRTPPGSTNATPPVAGIAGPAGGMQQQLPPPPGPPPPGHNNSTRSPEMRSGAAAAAAPHYMSGGGGGGMMMMMSGSPAGAGGSSTSGIPFDPETHVEVYNPVNNTLLILSLNDICYLPPPEMADGGSASAPTMKLCPNFDASRPFDSCPANARCKYVHARIDNAVSQDIHVNYAWLSLEDVNYERFPAGGPMLHVAPPNASVATDEIPSHLVLKTRALQSNRRVISHCAHYYFNRMCNRGSSCYFVHAVSLAPLREGAPPPPPEEATVIRRIWGRTHARTKLGATHQTPPLAPMRGPPPAIAGGDRGISPVPPYGAEQQQQHSAAAVAALRGFGISPTSNGSFVGPSVPNNSFNLQPGTRFGSQQQVDSNGNIGLSPFAREWDPAGGPPPPPPPGQSPFLNFSSSASNSKPNSALMSPNTAVLLGGGAAGAGSGMGAAGGSSSSLMRGGDHGHFQQQQQYHQHHHSHYASGGGAVVGLPPMDIGPPAVGSRENSSFASSSGGGGAAGSAAGVRGNSEVLDGRNNSMEASNGGLMAGSSKNSISQQGLDQREAQVVDNVLHICDDDE